MTHATTAPPADSVGAHFDWYAATIDDSPAEVESVLSAALGASVAASTPMHGYEHGRELRDGDGLVLARLLYGGHEKPHAFASGAPAARFADVVRSVWPRQHAPGSSGGHYVTRFDSAIDYDEGRPVWDRLYRSCVSLAERKNLRLGTAGDWITPESEYGRTLYVGSPTSDVQVRLYEKGKQVRQALADPFDVAGVSPNWVRLEVRVRPQRDARHRAASSSPLEGFGYAGWTRDLLSDIAGLDVQRVAIQEPRETDDERAYLFMVRQYGKMLVRRAADLGGWDALGLDIRRQASDLGIHTDPH